MRQIIVYLAHPSPRETRLLREVIGRDHDWGSVLPIASAPTDDDAALDRGLALLAPLLDLPRGTAAFKQPTLEALAPLAEDEALERVTTSEVWRTFLRDFEVDRSEVRLRVSAHPRCWLVAASVPGGGIPPGVGFIVDTHAGQVLQRRFVDLFAPDGPMLGTFTRVVTLSSS